MSNEIIKYTSDRADLVRWMDTYLVTYEDTKYCDGGRLVHSRDCCLHCGSFVPDEKCLSPKPERGKKK